MIWALLPWVWWALRRTMVRGANPLPALVLGYLLVTVGYVFGTIMLIVVLAGLPGRRRAAPRPRGACAGCSLSGVLLGLVAVTVYLPGVLTRLGDRPRRGLRLRRQVHHRPARAARRRCCRPRRCRARRAICCPTPTSCGSSRSRSGSTGAGRAAEWRPIGGLLLFTRRRPWSSSTGRPGSGRCGGRSGSSRSSSWPLVVLLVVAWHRFGARPTVRAVSRSRSAWVALAGLLSLRWAARCGRPPAARSRGGGRARRWSGGSWCGPARAGSRPRPGVLTLAVLGRPARVLPDPAVAPAQLPRPTWRPTRRSLAGAVGDVLQVGASDNAASSTIRGPLDELLIGSAWYLNDHPMQNTYTAISYRAYKDRYCVYYQGDTCPEAARHPVQHRADHRQSRASTCSA